MTVCGSDPYCTVRLFVLKLNVPPLCAEALHCLHLHTRTHTHLIYWRGLSPQSVPISSVVPFTEPSVHFSNHCQMRQIHTHKQAYTVYIQPSCYSNNVGSCAFYIYAKYHMLLFSFKRGVWINFFLIKSNSGLPDHPTAESEGKLFTRSPAISVPPFNAFQKTRHPFVRLTLQWIIAFIYIHLLINLLITHNPSRYTIQPCVLRPYCALPVKT